MSEANHHFVFPFYIQRERYKMVVISSRLRRELGAEVE